MDVNEFLQGIDTIYKTGSRAEIYEYLLLHLNQATEENDGSASVTVLNEMVGFHRSISEHASAIQAANQAIAVLRSMGYENTVPFGTTLLNAATAHRAAGDNMRAAELFAGALSILSQHLPADDYQLAGVYNNASSLYEELGNYGEALGLLEKAVEILKKRDGLDVDTATAMTNLALVLLKLGRLDEAMEHLEQAMALFREADAKTDGPHYGAALAGMGEACYRMGKYDEAMTAYQSALEHIRAAVGENADYAFTLRNCAVACEAVGASEQAEMMMARAHEILRALGMRTDVPEDQADDEAAPARQRE